MHFILRGQFTTSLQIKRRLLQPQFATHGRAQGLIARVS